MRLELLYRNAISGGVRGGYIVGLTHSFGHPETWAALALVVLAIIRFDRSPNSELAIALSWFVLLPIVGLLPSSILSWW